MDLLGVDDSREVNGSYGGEDLRLSIASIVHGESVDLIADQMDPLSGTELQKPDECFSRITVAWLRSQDTGISRRLGITNSPRGLWGLHIISARMFLPRAFAASYPASNAATHAGVN